MRDAAAQPGWALRLGGCPPRLLLLKLSFPISCLPGYTRADGTEFDGTPATDAIEIEDSYYGDGTTITINTCIG